jgi:hypothetical protein
VSGALREPAAWCQVLMLHLNTKHCAVKSGGAALAVAVGRKFDQPLSDAQKIDFAYSVAKADANYLNVRLSADTGPLSTRDYSIVLEATPADNGKTAMHMSYAYAYGTAARLAMKGYLATLGSDKVGFTPRGRARAATSAACAAWWSATPCATTWPSTATSTRPRRASSSSAWARGSTPPSSTRRQLHEVDRNDYMEMKRHEFQRLQQPAS